MKTANHLLREMYLDFMNNYISVSAFAEHNGITTEQAQTLLMMGKQLHEEYVKVFG